MGRSPFAARCLLAAALVGALFAAPALAAEATATITLKNGETIKAERIFPTYMTVVALLPGTGMRLIPTDSIKSINGVPYEQIYWGETHIFGEEAIPGEIPASPEATPEATPAAPERGGVLPLAPGTTRAYSLSGQRTTWVRRGRTMDRQPTKLVSGLVRSSVVGAAPEGPVALRESLVERVGGDPAREVQSLHLLEQRPGGTYLVGYDVERGGEVAADGAERINVPPQLWPERLEVGQVWTVGPFKRDDMYHVGRMEVVGREAVSVPAGEYPEAYRVVGFSHVWAGVENLAAGRLITDHGTIETTTWVVPGVGPVKEERKVHLHQDFFPVGQTGFETPFVVEELTTRTLTEFQGTR